MTPVLPNLPTTPLPGQGLLGLLASPEVPGALDFDTLLAADALGLGPVEEGAGLPLPWDPSEAALAPEKPRPQGRQVTEADLWPTSTVPASPPLGGQALATSAPGSPDGPQLTSQSALDALIDTVPSSNGGEPHETAPQGDQPADARTSATLGDAPPRPEATAPHSLEPTSGTDGASPSGSPPAPEGHHRSSAVARPAPMPPQPAPEPMEQPLWSTRVDPNGAVRVEVDGELSIEVRPAHRGMHVTLDGTPQALQPMDGIEGDIDAALQDAGSHLHEFVQRRRPNKDRKDSGDGDVPAVSDEPDPTLSGASLIHVVA